MGTGWFFNRYKAQPRYTVVPGSNTRAVDVIFGATATSLYICSTSISKSVSLNPNCLIAIKIRLILLIRASHQEIGRCCQILKLDHFFSSNAPSYCAVLYAIKEAGFSVSDSTQA